MLPGKTYTPEEVLRIALRRKWWIIVPFVLGTIVAVAYGKSIPLLYRSDTLIILVPQRVAGGYVKAAPSGSLEERLSEISQQILSRARLEQIVKDFNLYEAERRTLPIEEVVKRMRAEDVQLHLETRESFRLSYVGLNPKTVQQVTQRLASLFIEKDVSDREAMTKDTSHFLDSELADAKHRLEDYEAKVGEYRRQYSSQLQSAAAGHVQAVNSAQAQLQLLEESVNRDEERHLLLEHQLADLESGESMPAPATTTAVVDDPRVRRLEASQAQLRELQTRLKPDHPDIRALERTIRDLQADLQADAGHRDSPATVASPPVNQPARERRARELRAQMDELEKQTHAKQEQDRRLRATIAEHQANLDAVPRREAELVELTRDYAALQGTYANLLSRQQDFRLTSSLEQRSLGDHFNVLDPARESERPVGPRRLKIYVAGVVGSLVLGILLAGLLEYIDSSFRSTEDVEQALKLPVLATIPVISASLAARHASRSSAG